MTALDSTRPALVFCSYSHRDRELCAELKAALSSLVRQNLIDFFWDRLIDPGEEWNNEIASQLEQADIILLLISIYFVDSNYCFRREMTRALERHDAKSAVVLPIYLRYGDYEGLPFEKLQGLPPDRIPVTDRDVDPHKAWMEVSKGIRRAREKLLQRRTAGMPYREAVAAVPDRASIVVTERDTYLRHLIINAERNADAHLALDVHDVQSGRRVDAESALREWCRHGERRLLLLTGVPGSGKTTTLRNVVATLARDRLAGGDSPLPLFLTPQLLSRSFNALRDSYGEGRAVIDEILRGIPSLVVVDGLDENAIGEPAAERLIDLIALAPLTTRFITSCRTHASAAIREDLDRAGHAHDHFEIRPLNDAQVQAGLSRSGLATNASLRLLARAPVILKLVREASIAHPIGSVTTLLDLYRLAVHGALTKAIGRETALAQLTPERLEHALSDVAKQMFPRTSIPMVRLKLDVNGLGCNEIVSALAAAGLLSLDSHENVSFSHASYFDYFFALLLYRSMMQWQAKYLARVNLIYAYHINLFLVPMLLERAGDATPAETDILRQLRTEATAVGSGLLTRTISRRDFATFARATGWRRDTGFGDWRTFHALDGTTASSDGTLPEPGPDALVMNSSREFDSSPAAPLSWYDAMQFAIWAGGRLPTLSEIASSPQAAGCAREWTSDWYHEDQALVAVRGEGNADNLGFNPDFRAASIGFRVMLHATG